MSGPGGGKDAYSLFCGPVSPSLVAKVFAATSSMLHDGVERLHLLFQSTGGSVGDGVCLFNYLRTLPLDVYAYNAGAVHSIGTIAYLGARRRIASRFAVFMLHRARITVSTAPATRLRALASGIVCEDTRLHALVRSELQLTDEQWALLEYEDLILTADQAVSVGLAHELGEFSVPREATFYPLL